THAVEFSKTGPSPGRKKGPDSRPRPQNRGTNGCRLLSGALRCGRLQGLFDAAGLGSRGIVAPVLRLSNGTKADELTLARLDDRAVEHRGVDLVRGEGLAVQLHPALVDLPAPVARRAAELRLEDRGQIDGAVAGCKR